MQLRIKGKKIFFFATVSLSVLLIVSFFNVEAPAFLQNSELQNHTISFKFVALPHNPRYSSSKNQTALLKSANYKKHHSVHLSKSLSAFETSALPLGQEILSIGLSKEKFLLAFYSSFSNRAPPLA